MIQFFELAICMLLFLTLSAKVCKETVQEKWISSETIQFLKVVKRTS